MKASCLGIAIVIFFILLNRIYKKSVAYYNLCIDIEPYMIGVANDIKIVNVGSTYSKFAFNSLYKRLQLNACDLSMQAQCLEMDYAILKQYRDHIANKSIIFITLAACCMLYDDGKDKFFYQIILGDENNPAKSLRGKMEKNLPLLLHPKRISGFLRDKKIYLSIYDTQPFCVDEEMSNAILSNLAQGWVKMFDLCDLKCADFSPKNNAVINKNTNTLLQMVDFCLDCGAQPVIVVPPFTDRLNKYFSHEFTEQLIDRSVNKVIENRNVPFLNYQWNSEFQNNYSLFTDGGFRLNEVGSEIFGRKVFHDLKGYGIQVTNEEFGERIYDAQ